MLTVNESNKVYPANAYTPVQDTWIVTSYFNPNRYLSKLKNYELFKHKISSSGAQLLTVECAFNHDDFELKSSDDILQIRSQDVMWQKERLLNIAVASLPKEIKKIVWLDCDILFENPNWIVQTSELLEHFPVVQPYETLIRLPKGKTYYENEGTEWKSFGYTRTAQPHLSFSGIFSQHGHTGIAWAIQADIIRKSNFYDTCLSGNADHLMAHAMCGDFSSLCITKYLGSKGKMRDDFIRWAEPFYESVQGKVGYIPGNVLHLWHGDKKDRQYIKKSEELKLLDFDPSIDLRLNKNNCWEWNSEKCELHEWAISFFDSRKEDGVE
jgi:hypothetical protein